MKPEFSIILLTVLAGMAEGVLFFLVGADAITLLKGGAVSFDIMLYGVILSVALAGLGTMASFFHLHHKSRGIKAIKRWRFSWLSREVLLLPLFIGLTVVYGICAIIGVATWLRLLSGLAGVFVGLALGISSGMIYCSVRYIREWANPYTPINFVVIGLAGGSVILLATLELVKADHDLIMILLRMAIPVTVIAMTAKGMSYLYNSTAYSSTTLQSAIGAWRSDIVLMDTGCAYENYNTREYFHKSGKKIERAMIWFVMTVLFILPLSMLTLDYVAVFNGHPSTWGVLAALSMLIGGLAERWLFFVQGNHVQNLYYGRFVDKNGKNPILQPGKTAGPLPPVS